MHFNTQNLFVGSSSKDFEEGFVPAVPETEIRHSSLFHMLNNRVRNNGMSYPIQGMIKTEEVANVPVASWTP